MAANNLRDQLHEQIDKLPGDLVAQIADFTLFLMARRQIKPLYADWDETDWQSFALEQLFDEEDEVTYTLKDAKEVYRS